MIFLTVGILLTFTGIAAQSYILAMVGILIGCLPLIPDRPIFPEELEHWRPDENKDD